jgi:hypothetical protein
LEYDDGGGGGLELLDKPTAWFVAVVVCVDTWFVVVVVTC